MKIVPCDILNNSCNNYGDKSKNVEMNELNQIQSGQSGIFSIQNSNLKANPDVYSNQNEETEEILEHADLYEKENCFGVFVLKTRSFIVAKLTSPLAKRILIGALLILYPIYIGFAMKLNNPFNFPSNLNSSTIIDDYVFSNNRGLAFLVLNVIAFMFLFWDKVVKTLFKSNRFNLERFNTCNTNWINIPILKKLKSWIVVVLVSILCIAYLIYDMKELDNLISLAGLGCFILICIFLSEHPGRVNFYTLSVGILIQFILGVFILRSEFGYQLFKFLGAQVTTFLDYTDNGSRLVFGDSFKDHYFAFKVMPVVIFFSAVVNVLYHYGAVQYFLIKIAWLINFLMKTSPTESVNSVANIFVGCAEAPLLIKPFLPHMTESELFAVMVAAFSTVSGSVLAAYIGFGVPPDHLITAGLMSAPASLAIAKILFPETKKTNADWVAIRSVKIKKFNNVFEAISNGAIDMLKAVGAILANLIAFVSIFSLLDTACIWFFSMINLKNFGLASILQFIFWPFAFLMGVKIEDCLSVAKLVGLKVFVNEFVAYTHLGSVINFRNNATANGTLPLYKNGTLPIPDGISMIWNDKSIVIATYALCGFANFGTIGIEIAILSVFAPTRTKVFIKYAAKAMIAGNFSSFMNACIAGLLFKKI